jgi:uncharacterized protein YggE
MNRASTVLVGGVLLFSVMAAEARGADAEPRRITVNGDAEIQVVPDMVVLTLGIETSNPDLMVARAENDRRVTAMLQAARRAGIASKDVNTDYLNIEPRYDGRTFLGFYVQKTVVVTLRDVSRFESLLTDQLKGGANYVLGIEFRTTELRKHRDAARALAMTATQQKAAALASSLTQRVGRPVTIHEGYSGWWSSYRGGWGRGSYGQAMSQNVVQSSGESGAASDSPLAPGTIRVNASVTVTFELQ